MSEQMPIGGADSSADPKRSVARSYDAQFHGTSELRGADCPTSRFYDRGRFGRLFRNLSPLRISDLTALLALGRSGGPMDGSEANPDHPEGLPAGFTFLGQFIDHDITFDPTSSLERQVDPEAVANFRTPSLELDNVYGAGPGASPHLYRREDRDRLLIEQATGGAPETDLPRNSQGTALLGDPRNDENLIVSQLHVAFLRFHNTVVERVRQDSLVPPGQSVFEAAQRLARWHYQWIMVNEYLPAIVGEPVVRAVLANRRFFSWRNDPYIPVEFSVAAFRFGHSQVRDGYRINAGFAAPIFPDLAGGKRIDAQRVIQWGRFFGSGAVPGKAFDTRISEPLFRLPFAAGSPADPRSLAQRNLLRGIALLLPSGQDVARTMQEPHGRDVAEHGVSPIEVLTPDELGEASSLGFGDHTPLWYYLLREAEVKAGGKTLGPAGGRIVAEVLIGLLQGDRESYLAVHPKWRPLFGRDGHFEMVDLLQAAGHSLEINGGPPANAAWTA